MYGDWSVRNGWCGFRGCCAAEGWDCGVAMAEHQGPKGVCGDVGRAEGEGAEAEENTEVDDPERRRRGLRGRCFCGDDGEPGCCGDAGMTVGGGGTLRPRKVPRTRLGKFQLLTPDVGALVDRDEVAGGAGGSLTTGANDTGEARRHGALGLAHATLRPTVVNSGSVVAENDELRGVGFAALTVASGSSSKAYCDSPSPFKSSSSDADVGKSGNGGEASGVSYSVCAFRGGRIGGTTC